MRARVRYVRVLALLNAANPQLKKRARRLPTSKGVAAAGIGRRKAFASASGAGLYIGDLERVAELCVKN